jgi:hypothetical protein
MAGTVNEPRIAVDSSYLVIVRLRARPGSLPVPE